jgi:G patch domain-containing protein 1
VSTYDIGQFQFEVKEDLFGLGYKRLDVGTLFGHKSSDPAHESPAASLLFPEAAGKSTKVNKKGFSGHAFGVGDFEDDEDIDVYKQDSYETYDFELNDRAQKDTKKLLNKSYGFGEFDDYISIIKKFLDSKSKQMPVKVYAAAQPPADFNPMHKLEKRSRFDDKFGTKAPPPDESDDMNVYLKSVSQRSEVLGETAIQPESVLDLVSAADREFLKSQALKLSTPTQPAAVVSTQPRTVDTDKEKKAKRYESFVSFRKKDYKDAYNFVDTKDLTEWDRQKEKEEFEHRYEDHLRKLELVKKDNLKFVSISRLNEENVEVETVDKKGDTLLNDEVEIKPVAEEVVANPLDKAVGEKKYGDATRTEVVWRPHPTVCKRFNVKNPYPE